MRVLKFFHSTAKRALWAVFFGLSCLFAIALMACGGDTPPTESPASGSTGTPANAYPSISAGGAHTCWLRTDDSVECWGSNEHGESNPPDGSFASISAGAHHTCGVMTDGSAACWGSNEHGESSQPGGSFASVSAGVDYTCGVRTDGSVECWGHDEFGEASQPSGEFASVSAGFYHTCGLRPDGSVECWGSNKDGQAAPPDGSFASVSAGALHTCGVMTDGSIECWGSNEDLDGNVVGQAEPPSGSFASVSAGWHHTCGVRLDGSVECWGSNELFGIRGGQAAPPYGSFASVSAGSYHTCGVRTDGSVECWGFSSDGAATEPASAATSASATEPASAATSASTAVIPAPFTIGVMESLTGPGETYGRVAVQAKQMAVDEINAAGGINGRMLELVVEDSRCSAQDAITAYNKLTAVDGVKIILGTSCSGAMLGAAALAEPDGVVLFSGLATNPEIAEAGDYIFRTSMSDAQLGIDTGNVLWADGIRKLATINEATDYAEGVRRESVAQFEKRGGQVVGEERYPSDTTDFRSQLTMLINANPDAIHISAQTEFAGGTIVKQVRELGYAGPLYSEVVPTLATALEIAGEATTGLKAITAELDPDNDRAQEVLASFKQRYGYVLLPWHLGSAYDDVYIAAECLKQTGDDQDADGFRDCLYGIKWSGALGESYSFDEDGEVVGLVNMVVEVLPVAERTEGNKGYKVLGGAPTE